MNLKFNWNALIVLATIALALTPLCLGRFDREIASWHLAAAANALQLGNGQFEESLEKAEAICPDLTQVHDYWLVRVMQALVKEPNEVPHVVVDAIRANPDFRSIGRYAFERLQAQKEYPPAIEVLESTLSEAQRSQPEMLNELAYFRSLAAIELDRGLKDINEALEYYPESEAFRDTRAWILFQMGRPLEALEDAQFAVERLEKLKQRLASDPLTRFSRLLQGGGQAMEPGEETLTQSEADPLIWNEGVLRYHRARILEALGREEEAEEDWSWLKQHNLPLDDRLQ